jgi:hypothetical protein
MGVIVMDRISRVRAIVLAILLGRNESEWRDMVSRRQRKKARWKYLLNQEPFDRIVPRRYRPGPHRLGRRERRYIERKWLPRAVAWGQWFRLDLEFALAALPELPARLGFDESAPGLAQARDKVIQAIRFGGDRARGEALGRYLDLGELQTVAYEPLEAGRARIGLGLAEAQIWREAGDLVGWLSNLEAAYDYADNQRLLGYVVIIGTIINHYLGSGELLQARGRTEEAIEAYLKREPLIQSSRERGLLNFRLAECYWALLRGDKSVELVGLLGASLASAMHYLEAEPEQTMVLGLLEEVEQEFGDVPFS